MHLLARSGVGPVRTGAGGEVASGERQRGGLPGLFAEMFDPRTGAQLGNFPQAFSHIGFINAVLYLFYAEGREIPVPDPIGSKEHRNMLGKRHVEGVDHRSRMVKM